MLFLGMENLGDFEEAWAAEADRSAGKRIPFGCPEPKKLLYSRWGRLGDQVERLLARVDPARTKILFFDDFAARTGEAYREVLDFLGLPDDGRTDFPVVNQASKVRWFPLHRASHVLSRGLVRAKRALGIEQAGFGLLERFRRLTAHRGQRGALRPEFKTILKAHFREDIRKLSRLTGRDLSAWLAP
jgi:hypothetical protein